MAGNSNCDGARPVHLIIPMIKWIWTNRLPMKSSLSLFGRARLGRVDARRLSSFGFRNGFRVQGFDSLVGGRPCGTAVVCREPAAGALLTLPLSLSHSLMRSLSHPHSLTISLSHYGILSHGPNSGRQPSVASQLQVRFLGPYRRTIPGVPWWS